MQAKWLRHGAQSAFFDCVSVPTSGIYSVIWDDVDSLRTLIFPELS